MSQTLVYCSLYDIQPVYALLLLSGLIHANHGSGITNYITKELRNQSNEVRLLHLSYRSLYKRDCIPPQM